MTGAWFTDMKNMGMNFIEDDFSAYDSTQSAGCHEAEKWFYNQFPGHEMAKATVAFQDKTVGYGKYWSYSCHNTRKSGDQNTSVGNTYINFLSHAYAIKMYEQSKNVVVKYHMIGLGDDNLLAVDVNKENLHEFMLFCETIIIAMGLKPKMKISNEAPSYCSGEFIPVTPKKTSFTDNSKDSPVVYVLVPSVLRQLAKIGFTHTKLAHKDNLGHLKGNALGNAEMELVPILRVFYRHYSNLDVKEIKTYNNYDKATNTTKVQKIKFVSTPVTDQWFLDVFGLDTNQVMELESYIISILTHVKGQPCLWNHPLISVMIARREAI
jgi:hypothetical protein